MSLFYITFLFVVYAFVAFLVYGSVRNNRVFKFRGALLNEISRCADMDITLGRSFNWRYDVLKKCRYDTMLYSRQKLTVENFFPNNYFIDVRRTELESKGWKEIGYTSDPPKVAPAAKT